MENIFRRLDFVIRETDDVAKQFDKKELDDIHMFCMCMLDRLNFSSESLRILLRQFLENSKVEYASGIIIRSVLLDYLIILNALDLYGKNLADSKKLYEELSFYCLMMLSDSVRNTLEYFDTLENQIPKDVLSNMYKNLVAMNPRCFEDYLDNQGRPIIKIKQYKSPKQLFQTLVSSESLNNYKSVYQAYLYYSKYDHFGNMFYGLSRIKLNDRLANIDKVLEIFPKVLLFTITILETFYGPDSWIGEKRKLIVNFIDEV